MAIHGHGRIVACAPLIPSDTMRTYQLDYLFEAIQQSPFEDTNFFGIPSPLNTSIINTFNKLCPLDNRDVYDPFSAPGLGTTSDAFPVGDLNRKTLPLPLHGMNTIAMKTFWQKQRRNSRERRCSFLIPNAAITAGTQFAKAVFTGPVNGAIVFVSLNMCYVLDIMRVVVRCKTFRVKETH